MRAGVVEAQRTPVQRGLRLVAGRVTLRFAHGLLTLIVPVADERPVVGGRTVGVDHHLVAVGRQRHEVLERRRVADHPGRQHRGTRQCGHHEMTEPRSPHQRPGEHDPRQRKEWQQQDSFAASQRGERDQRAEQRRRRQPRAVAPSIGDDHRDRHQERHQSLGVQQAVDQPQVRIDRGERCGNQTHRRAAQALGEHADRQHQAGTDHDRHHLVIEVARAPESRADRQHHRIQRAVERAGTMDAVGDPVEGFREPATASEHVGGRVVEERVTAIGALGSHCQQGDDSNEEPGGDHGRQRQWRSNDQLPVTAPHQCDQSHCGDHNNSQRATDHQRPHERGDHVAAQKCGAIDLEHPLVILASNQCEGRFACQQHARPGDRQRAPEPRGSALREGGRNEAHSGDDTR